VLVASTDGVGTKLKVAFLAGRHGTVGEDLVNHCVNDILVQGARPLFFMDYFATGELRPEVTLEVVEGIAAACREAGCALLGGETAQMPGFYADGEYDLAGFLVGLVGRDSRIGPTRVSMFSNLQPLVALAVAWIALGEVPTIWQGLGAGSIMTGLIITRT